MKKFFAILLFLLSASIGTNAQYDKDVFMWRGRQYLQDGKYAMAIENFNVLAVLDTTNYWNYLFRGIAKYNLGDLRGAQKDFNTSVRLNPIFTDGYHYRAITRSRFGEYDEALNDLNYAIQLRPGFIGLYFSRGVTYFLSQQFENAVKDFDRYIRKVPKDPSAYLNRGASYLFLKDTVKALSDYNRAIELDRFDPECFIRRGRVYAAQENYSRAISDMDHALELDSTNTFALFNRALMYYELKDYNKAMTDLDNVLVEEPGNALTLYNRSLIKMQVGQYDEALEDIDRVININPDNVLAYFNRAALFIEMGKWRKALQDYDRAIELYPDFAKAYLNRSFVKSKLGMTRESKEDYKTAQQKVQEYQAKNIIDEGSFADTTKKYSSLLALDADFAKKGFDDELLQHRDIDIRLRPLFKFKANAEEGQFNAMGRQYENPLLNKFISDSPLQIAISNDADNLKVNQGRSLASILAGDTNESAGNNSLSPALTYFLRGLDELRNKQYNSALNLFNLAVKLAGSDGDKYEALYKAFYLMNRGVLKAEMIEFIASIDKTVQTITLDDQKTIRTKVSDRTDQTYDYSEAIADIRAAIAILPDIPHLYFNLGNLLCLSGDPVSSIELYDKAIEMHPYMSDAFFNRGLVLIFLKDREKGCIDLSRAGEMGIPDAYGVIKKYCKTEE